MSWTLYSKPNAARAYRRAAAFLIYQVPLVPFGHNVHLSCDNWREYVQKLRHLRLTESSATLQAFRNGLAMVLPVEIFPLFTAEELESLICGVQDIDVNLLRSCTEYDEGVTSDDQHVLAFWEVLEEMQPSERTAFLRFVWARSRMPSSAKVFFSFPVILFLGGLSFINDV